jgi:hypothetical protein
LPRSAADRDAELNWLKTLVKQLADKVNAPGDTPAARIAAVEDCIDEVALHGVRLGTTLGLAAMATHTSIDYSTAGVFLLTVDFLSVPSGNTARIQISNQNRFLPLVQTVLNGIPRYK